MNTITEDHPSTKERTGEPLRNSGEGAGEGAPGAPTCDVHPMPRPLPKTKYSHRSPACAPTRDLTNLRTPVENLTKGPRTYSVLGRLTEPNNM